MKTMLIFIAIVLVGILAKPLFDAIVSLPFPTSGKYDPQGGGDGYGIAIIGFIVTRMGTYRGMGSNHSLICNISDNSFY